MNFRIYASGLVLILVYQLAIAAVVVWFVVHCEMAAGAGRPDREAFTMIAGESG